MCSPWEAHVRLHTVVKPQPRLDAMRHRDRQCTTQGCDWPEALCPRHDSYAHNPTYEKKTIPNGRVIFSRT